jgi:cytochrome b6-f complex iron-sulfur subunit
MLVRPYLFMQGAAMEGATQFSATRRETLATIGAAAAVACVGATLGGCQQNKDKDKPPLITSGTVNIGPAADYPAGRTNQKFVETYGIIIANDSGTRVAIRPKCTHLGCTVTWDQSARGYECPCHHSKFSMLGLPLSGPAKKNLPLVTCDPQPDGTLTVDLSKLYGM